MAHHKLEAKSWHIHKKGKLEEGQTASQLGVDKQKHPPLYTSLCVGWGRVGCKGWGAGGGGGSEPCLKILTKVLVWEQQEKEGRGEGVKEAFSRNVCRRVHQHLVC